MGQNEACYPSLPQDCRALASA